MCLAAAPESPLDKPELLVWTSGPPKSPLAGALDIEGSKITGEQE